MWRLINSWTINDARKFFNYLTERLKGFGQIGDEYYKQDFSYGLIDFEFCEKMKFYPFLNKQKFKFVKLLFSNMTVFKKCINMFQDWESREPKDISLSSKKPYPPNLQKVFNLYESNVDPINRFCHLRNITTAGWITITSYSIIDPQKSIKYSRSQLCLECVPNNINPCNIEKLTNIIAPLYIFSYDIETNSSTGEFPDPKNDGDYIVQIGCVVYKYGTNEKLKIVIVNGKCDNIEGVNVISCKNECILLQTFCSLIETLDIDIITGFNTWGFDDKYVWYRCVKYGLGHYTNKFARLTCLKTGVNLSKHLLKSSAYGSNEFFVIDTHGRETFDLLPAMRKDYKFDNFKLNTIATFFLKKQKVDMPIKVMFEKIKGTPADMAEVATYCIEDANLVTELIEKISIIPKYIEMAKTNIVPLSWLSFRGQQCRVFSLIIKEAGKAGYVVPISIKSSKTDSTEDEKYQGATVLVPRRGAYLSCVAGLDFASLYPSIMIAHNLCYSTIVMDDKYLGLPGVTYETIPVGPKAYTFVQPGEDNAYKGILPLILENLAKGRKHTKKLMEQEKDPFIKALLNGKQLSQKLVMNSAYGLLGANKGILPLKVIASCVTSKGRQMIDKTKELAEENYSGSVVLYGDSIPGYEKIVIVPREGYISGEVRIDSIVYEKDWTDYRLFKAPGCKCIDLFGIKQQYVPKGFFTYSKSGVVKIKRVIRHNVKIKKLYKISALDKDGVIRQVVVTEGHSLILADGTCAEANKLKIGDELWE